MFTTHRLTIDEVKGDREWSALEQDLLDECALGRVALLPYRDDCPKDTSDPDRRVRPALIRYLMEGGCDSEGGTRPNPRGVKLHGGWIDGVLDLEGCISSLDLGLVDCLFQQQPTFRDAELGGLYLTGSRAETGVDLHRLKTETNLHLRDGFHATGLVDLSGANITGQVDCTGGQFDGAGGRALDADAAIVGADVFLRDGFHATGEVNLIGAKITGQLDCTGGRFDGAGGRALNANAAVVGASVFLSDGFYATGLVDFVRARVEGNLQVTDSTLEDGMDLEAARIREGLFLRGLRGAEVEGPLRPEELRRSIPGTAGVCDLTETSCGVLRDDPGVWECFTSLRMGNFRYDRIETEGDPAQRLTWLERGLTEEAGAFDPQPYTLLARTYDSVGHRRAAAFVREAREDRLRDAEWARRAEAMRLTSWPVLGWLRPRVRALWSWVFKGLFGYGHAPARALIVVLAIWIGASWLYGSAFAAGQMAPNSDVILTAWEWDAAVAAGCPPVDWTAVGWAVNLPLNEGCEMPLLLWLRDGPAAPDYETFNARLYALDLFVPLDALGQETAWAPSRDRGWWGWVGYAMRMPIQLAGWIITAVGAAVLTGLVGRKE